MHTLHRIDDLALQLNVMLSMIKNECDLFYLYITDFIPFTLSCVWQYFPAWRYFVHSGHASFEFLQGKIFLYSKLRSTFNARNTRVTTHIENKLVLPETTRYNDTAKNFMFPLKLNSTDISGQQITKLNVLKIKVWTSPESQQVLVGK